MSSRVITILGYVVVGLACLTVEAFARRPGSRIPTFSQLIGFVMREKWGRLGILFVWWWLGFHFLSRS
ncbi:hypothetical protein GCM10009839_10390 [Catenulispora yoronensis]|uniref:Uncharacterized protein n=1 Tax=Catenulispora yoronensis TaxID=450799 RepID=A0ABN2TQK1_9ACTN